MKSKIFLVCTFACLALTISSCKKDDTTADAIILDYGDPAADGCGWFIKIAGSDSTYNPKNLPEMYKMNNLKVHISFRKLKTRFYCSQISNDPGPGTTEIQLDVITKE